MGRGVALSFQMDVTDLLFGRGDDLSALQMLDRSIVVFCIALVLVRLAGRRSFGQHSPFDACTTVLLGAILSRAVVGASPFWPTVAAGVALAVMHRVVGHLSADQAWFGRLINGPTVVLYADGVFHRTAMRHAQISERDVIEAARKSIRSEDLSRISRVMLEPNGTVSVTTGE